MISRKLPGFGVGFLDVRSCRTAAIPRLKFYVFGFAPFFY